MPNCVGPDHEMELRTGERVRNRLRRRDEFRHKSISIPIEGSLGEKLNEQTITLPEDLTREVDKAQEAWLASRNSRRLWNADSTLWTGRDESEWLGWLDILGNKSPDANALLEFARQVRAENFADVLLLGMGGSSLGPEVLAESLGSAPHYPRLHVLDSTDPQQVRRFESRIDLARTLFLVSSKSGTTLETSVLMDYFFAKASAGARRCRWPCISSPLPIPEAGCRKRLK